MGAEAVQYLLVGMFSPGNIAVPAQQSGLGESVTGFLFQLLSTNTEKLYPPAQALRANLGSRYSVVALVADQAILRRVISKRNITAVAAKDKAAVTALNMSGCSPSVKE